MISLFPGMPSLHHNRLTKETHQKLFDILDVTSKEDLPLMREKIVEIITQDDGDWFSWSS